MDRMNEQEIARWEHEHQAEHDAENAPTPDEFDDRRLRWALTIARLINDDQHRAQGGPSGFAQADAELAPNGRATITIAPDDGGTPIRIWIDSF